MTEIDTLTTFVWVDWTSRFSHVSCGKCCPYWAWWLILANSVVRRLRQDCWDFRPQPIPKRRTWENSECDLAAYVYSMREKQMPAISKVTVM